jgi:hypothetical protein
VTAGQSTANVTFNIPISTQYFSPTASIEVNLWNQAQLSTQEKQANCVIAHDVQIQADTVRCPVGIEYQPITPEKISVPVQTIQSSITITSTTVRVGEKYRIRIGGRSKDDCNSTSAFYEEVATSSHISLTQLSWLTTEMGCVKKP